LLFALMPFGGAYAQALPQGVQRDQAECYQQATNAANMVRGHPNQQALITSLYYGCMKQKGYAVPDQQQPQQQQPVAPQFMPRPQQPQSNNYQPAPDKVTEDANAQANEFMLLLDPSLYTKD
jgi:hypothetical protein